MTFTDTTINNRWTLSLPTHRAGFWGRGDWERERLDHMAETIEPQDNVLYIGAEEGDMPALLASWDANVFMVEPGERVWANIKAIWQHNPQLPTPQGCYVGFCGEADSHNWRNGLYLREHAQVGNWPECADGDIITDHAFPYLGSPGYRPIVTTDTLSDFFAPDMISLDVEGAEWRVLKGAKHTLAVHRPRIYLSLHPEFLFHQDKVYGEHVRNLIKANHYREELLSYHHEVHLYYEPLAV